MKRTKFIRLLVLLSALSLFLVGCGNISENADKSSGSEDKAINVGYIGALSGNSATMGIPGKNGIELAVEDINNDGGVNGKNINLVALDDEADPATSATQAEKLINDDKVVAILGGPNSGTVKANSQVISEYGVPELIAIAQEDTLIDESSPTYETTFSMTENNSYDVRAIAQFLKDQNYNKIGVIADNSAYGQGGIKTIQGIMDQEGIEIAQVVDHPVGAKDLTAQALKLQEANVDAVYVYSLGPDGALFMKTTKQINWDVPVIGGRGLNMKSFVDLAGDAANGMILPSVINPKKEAVQEFIKKYDEKYGDDPAHVYSALGYDAMMLLAEALKATDGEGGGALVSALEELKDIPTVSGGLEHKASFSKDKHYAPNENFVVFNEVSDGEFIMFNDEVESGW